MGAVPGEAVRAPGGRCFSGGSGDGGAVRVPEGVREGTREIVNILLCLLAVVGIGWSGTVIWQVWQARQQIDEACGGLFPAGRVLALSPAGGTVSHRLGDEGTIELDGQLPQECQLFSTEAGEKHHTDSGERWFFTGAVGATGLDDPWVPEDPMDQILDPRDPNGEHTGHAYPAQPLGGGITGRVTDTGVTVMLPCAKGMNAGIRVGTLWARASLVDPGPAFSDDGQPTAHDRDILADMAVFSANRLAGHLGCEERLPDAPEDVPALTPDPTPVSDARGTCGWYRETGLADMKPYPDQVLEARVDDKLWDERCVLLLSPSRAAELYQAHSGDELDYYDLPTHDRAYFAAFHTYSGDVARKVSLPTSGLFHDDDVPAEPGRAGRGTDHDPLWWASSTCGGKPLIHTLTLAQGYDKVATPAYDKVFRAYVAAVTERRSCTLVAFPPRSAFSSD